MANRIIFEKIESKTPQVIREQNNVGLDRYMGTMYLGPSVGKSFQFDRDDGMTMYTSTVKNIEYLNGNSYIITTRNSKYMVTLLAEVEPK